MQKGLVFVYLNCLILPLQKLYVLAVNLIFQKDNIDVVRIRKEGFIDNNSTRPTGKSTYIRAFKRGKYKLIADLEQIPGGAFGFGPGMTVGSASSNIQARFISRGSDFYLDVRGNGSATILSLIHI